MWVKKGNTKMYSQFDMYLDMLSGYAFSCAGFPPYILNFLN
jgi:hypothetical protein